MILGCCINLDLCTKIEMKEVTYNYMYVAMYMYVLYICKYVSMYNLHMQLGCLQSNKLPYIYFKIYEYDGNDVYTIGMYVAG